MPPHWLCTRVDFLRFLESILWKAGDVPWFAFPVIGFPGTLLKVLSRPPVPVQESPPIVPEIGPRAKEQALSSQESSLEVVSVLLASPDASPSLVFILASHSWSPVQSI